MATSVFVLQYVTTGPEGEHETRVLGVYARPKPTPRPRATAAVRVPEFSAFSRPGFEINPFVIDRDGFGEIGARRCARDHAVELESPHRNRPWCCHFEPLGFAYQSASSLGCPLKRIRCVFKVITSENGERLLLESAGKMTTEIKAMIAREDPTPNCKAGVRKLPVKASEPEQLSEQTWRFQSEPRRRMACAGRRSRGPPSAPMIAT